MAEKKVYRLSSRGRRFCAALIDEVLPIIVMTVMFIAIIVAASTSYYYDYGATVGSGVVILLCVLALIAYIVVEIVFFAKSQSIGKAILGMRVVSSKNGKPVGIWWMLLREFIVKPACGSAYFLGYIWILIDKQNRGWHDKILDTLVVDTQAVEPVAPEHRAPVEPVAPAAAAPVAEPVVEEVAAEPVVEPMVEEVAAEPVVEQATVETPAPVAEPLVEEVKVEPAEEAAPAVESVTETIEGEVPVLEMDPKVEEATVPEADAEVKLELLDSDNEASN